MIHHKRHSMQNITERERERNERVSVVVKKRKRERKRNQKILKNKMFPLAQEFFKNSRSSFFLATAKCRILVKGID